MQVVPVSSIPGNGIAQRHITIGIDIGQYHFIDHLGWKHEWRTESPREWWAKQQWLKAGGYNQDEMA